MTIPTVNSPMSSQDGSAYCFCCPSLFLPTHLMELSPCMWTSLISPRFEGVLCRSLELFLQPPPFQHSALQILVLQICFLELWWLPSAHFGSIWVLCSALCPGNCLQAANWTIVGLISFVSLPSGITVLLCLLSSIWNQLFHIFVWFSSCLWWKHNSHSS